MHHDLGVICQPLNAALDACANDGIERGKLGVSPAAYFDSVGGHGR